MLVEAEVRLKGGGVVCPIYHRSLRVMANVDEDDDADAILKSRAIQTWRKEMCDLPGIEVVRYNRIR